MLKAQSKGQSTSTASAPTTEDISAKSIDQIIFACDAGMGSSAMGASILRDKVKKAGLNIPVTNKAISNLTDVDRTLIVTQEELTPRAYQRTPRAAHVSVGNFLATPKYDEIVSLLTEEEVVAMSTSKKPVTSSDEKVNLNQIDEVVFAHGKAEGSATMGRATLSAIFKNKKVGIPISKATFAELDRFNAKNILVVTTIAHQIEVRSAAPNAQLLAVDSLVTTPEYDKMVDRMIK